MMLIRRPLKTVIKAVTLGVAVSFSSASHATLFDRGSGLIYDSVLDVTWLQDANLAFTQGYSKLQAGRLLTWFDALEWAAQLTYVDTVRSVTLTDWRLPNISPLDPALGFQLQVSTAGDQDDGYNISAPGTKYAGSTASELPYMYFNNLGNTSQCPVIGSFGACSTAGPESYTLNAGPFINLEKTSYWTNSNAGLPFLDAWGLDLGLQWGRQAAFNREAPRIAWAVRDGDVLSPIPEPSTSVMWGLALLAGVIGGRFKGRVTSTG